jgi:hypothetical protein
VIVLVLLLAKRTQRSGGSAAPATEGSVAVADVRAARRTQARRPDRAQARGQGGKTAVLMTVIVSKGICPEEPKRNPRLRATNLEGNLKRLPLIQNQESRLKTRTLDCKNNRI